MSFHQSLGLSIQLWKPDFAPAFNPKGTSLGAFDFASYEHASSVGVGFDSMSASRSADIEEAYWWLQNACGAHAEVQDETGVVVWEGRVNTVGLSAGGYSIQRGPLLDVANRCMVSYQLLIPETGESQEQTRTEAANNADSQARYGVQYQILSAGSVTRQNAEQIRDAHIAVNAWPQIPKQLSLTGGGGVSVNIECRGYYHWLSYPYRLISEQGTENASEKIQRVLDADPNQFYTGTPNHITSNALQVPAQEDQDRKASEIISSIVALGDSDFKAWEFGVWANRSVCYEPASTTLEYLQRTDDKKQTIAGISGEVIQPWAVMPGKWLAFTSILPGVLGVPLGADAENERDMYIKSVKYSAPYSLDLLGGNVYTLRQALAQWGLTGQA